MVSCKHWIQYTERRQTKQNTQHKHKKLTDNQEWAAVNTGCNSQNEDKQNTQHKHRKLTRQPGMGSCKHWIQYTERRQTKYTTQT